jgi:hydrogenase nickel incorporation protein HypA/HybF
MHESSLGKQVLHAVLAKAREVGAKRVCTVRGWIAETEQLDPRAIAFHFEAQARGTPAEGAHLELALRRIDAQCRACARVYQPDHHMLICPFCGHAESELLGHSGLGVYSMDVERQTESLVEDS